jgi:hypothetical protein
VHPDVRHRGGAAVTERMHMVELEPACFGTSHAVLPDERAPPAIPAPHLALHGGGNVSRIRALHLVAALSAFGDLARPDPLFRELLSLEVLYEEIERTFDDLGNIAIRDLVP